MSNPDQLASFLSALAQHGRTDVHSAFNMKEGRGYRLVKEPITEPVIKRHLESSSPIAIYPITGDLAQIAVLDIDNHDEALSWDDLVQVTFPILYALLALGFRPLAFRSGGGKGIHIWLLWKTPLPARRIRRYLARLLARNGLRVGTEGISVGAVEIYPKQDRVPEGGVGNPIALPLARQSAPLDDQLQLIPLDKYRPPSIAEVYSPELEAEEEGAGQATSSRIAATEVVLEGDLEEAQAALKFVPAEDYTVWIRMALILKVTFGDDGFAVWHEWSGSAKEKYPGEAACRSVWAALRPKGEVRLGSLFRAAQDKGWNGPSDPVIREMNERFGIFTHANRTMIIVKNGERQEEDEDLNWLAKQPFLDRTASERMPVGPDGGGTIPKARHWLAHPSACHYRRVVFDPGRPPGHNGRDWNIWSGFAVEAIPGGSWERLKDHILHNICQGDGQLFEWLLNWMALGVQQPSRVIGTAPVLHGLPGSGKSFLADAYGRVWGQHYVTITQREQVSGRFNAHLVGRRFVFVDEGTFGGDRREAGVIKTRVTERAIILEAKGVDPIKMQNRMIFMFASNEASIVPADMSDRRWQVFEVGDRNREDRAYFAAITAELEAGGYEEMLDELLRRDIGKGPDPRRIIKTEALFDQIMRAQGPTVGYLHQILDDGALPQQEVFGNGPGITTIRALHEDMRRTQPGSHYVQRNAFGRFLRRVIPGITTTQNGTYLVRRDLHKGNDETERSTRYVFPALGECRRAFEAHIGQAVPWAKGRDDWREEPEPPF